MMIIFSSSHNLNDWGIGTIEYQQILALHESGLLEKLYCDHLYSNCEKFLPNVEVVPASNEIDFDKKVSNRLRKLITEIDFDLLGCKSVYQQRMIKNCDNNSFILKHAVTTHPMVQALILNAEQYVQNLYFKVPIKPVDAKELRYSIQEFENVDNILCSSELVRKSFLEAGYDSSTLSVLHLGVDTEKYCPNHIESDVFRVGFVGSNWTRKGLPYLMTEFNKLQTEKKELLIRSDIQTTNPKTRVVSHGDCGFDAVIQVYDNSDITFLPTIEDGFGMSVLESMSCGVPVVTTRMAGVSEIITHGVDGFVYNTPLECSQALHNIYSNVQNGSLDLKKMGEQARKTAEKHTWINYRKEFIEWIKKVTT